MGNRPQWSDARAALQGFSAFEYHRASPPILGGGYNNLMSDSLDILILGGGVIGLSTAYFLAKEGLRIEVLDRGDLGQEASWAGGFCRPAIQRAKSPTISSRPRLACMPS